MLTKRYKLTTIRQLGTEVNVPVGGYFCFSQKESNDTWKITLRIVEFKKLAKKEKRMSGSGQEFRNQINDFFNRIGYKDYETDSTTISQLRLKKQREQEWSNKAGIYFFIQDDILKYVGRATPNVGLGRRVYNQINAFGGTNGWDHVINDDETKCGLIVFHNHDEWYWLAALEVLLIDRFRPEFNYRL